MVIHALEFGGDYISQDHKNIVNECSLTDMHENLLGYKSELILVYIAYGITCIFFAASLVEKRKRFWIILPVTLTHNHSNLIP